MFLSLAWRALPPASSGGPSFCNVISYTNYRLGIGIGNTPCGLCLG